MKSLLILLLCLFSPVALGQRRVRKIEKSIINYLGTNFLLLDGCPEPPCDSSKANCQQTISTIRSLYAHCLQSAEGQHVGCLTENINDKDLITLPVYATKCSAMCYESDPKNLEKIHPCPNPVFRRHSRLMLVSLSFLLPFKQTFKFLFSSQTRFLVDNESKNSFLRHRPSDP